MVSELGSKLYFTMKTIGLILIVVEYGLGGKKLKTKAVEIEGLNPYCSGIWSRR